MASASIRDPDNLDSSYGPGDEVTITFTVDTDQPRVISKWDIDKYLTFCTDCNPNCERGPAGNPNRRKKVEGQSNCGVWNSDNQRCQGINFGPQAYDNIDDEYNGLGTAYTGKWTDPRTLVITIQNATLPRQGECEGTGNMDWRSMKWHVTLSYSAAQAPMKRCAGTFYDAFKEVCDYGATNNNYRTTDQFGNENVMLYGRMLGPRYPHRWDSGACDNYRAFWEDYEAGNKRKVVIRGDVGPFGTPAISQFIADDPDDRDLVYGDGDTLTVIFDRATDRSRSSTGGVHAGGPLYVDGLFSFTAQLGRAYSGQG